MKEKILSAIESPKELEILYQENPKEFHRAFVDVYAQHPESVIVQVWNERLSHIGVNESQLGDDVWSYKDILLVVVLSLIVGTIIMLFTKSENYNNYEIVEWFYTRNLVELFISSLMIYFFFQRPQSRKTIMLILVITIGAWLYLALLPYEYAGSTWEFHKKFRTFDDAIAVAGLHIPIFMWLILGIAFAGKNWKVAIDRMNFMRYNGEVIVYTTMIVIGGVILTGITLALLDLIDYKFSNWYTENIIPYGIAAAPIIATFLLDKIIGRRLNIAPTLAKIFIPLFLITTIVYLILIVVYRQSPFHDRNYLMAFNILLIVVLGLLMFSIAERDSSAVSGLSDYMNIGLVLTTLVIDIVALSAVLFRTTTDVYGLTPNRIAILGINLLIFCHLAGILFHYARFVLKKDNFLKLEKWIAGYLPAYAIWSLAISIVLPVIFWYR